MPKRWMNVKELGKYLGYSNDHIYKLRDGEFIEDIHFHKKGKLLFDRIEIDKWVVGDQKNTALPSHKIVGVKQSTLNLPNFRGYGLVVDSFIAYQTLFIKRSTVLVFNLIEG